MAMFDRREAGRSALLVALVRFVLLAATLAGLAVSHAAVQPCGASLPMVSVSSSLPMAAVPAAGHDAGGHAGHLPAAPAGTADQDPGHTVPFVLCLAVIAVLGVAVALGLIRADCLLAGIADGRARPAGPPAVPGASPFALSLRRVTVLRV